MCLHALGVRRIDEFRGRGAQLPTARFELGALMLGHFSVRVAELHDRRAGSTAQLRGLHRDILDLMLKTGFETNFAARAARVGEVRDLAHRRIAVRRDVLDRRRELLLVCPI